MLLNNMLMVSVSVAVTQITLLYYIKSLGFIFDTCLSFDQNNWEVCKVYDYHIYGLHHVYGCTPSRIIWDIPYLRHFVPHLGQSLPGTLNVPYFNIRIFLLKYPIWTKPCFNSHNAMVVFSRFQWCIIHSCYLFKFSDFSLVVVINSD